MGGATRRVDDAMLIREAQRGNRAAFEELIRQYDHAVLRLALHLTGSEPDAQDIYQEAFLKAYRSVGRFRFECSFYTWLYRIVTNLCLDHLRKRKVRREESPVAHTESGTLDFMQMVPEERVDGDPQRHLMSRELGRRIGEVLRGFTPRERMVFELRHYQGMRLKAIGEVLGTSEEAAKNCLFRATQKMRQALGDFV